MRITIVDVEWYSKKSFLPNPRCMKISSYYKQQNAIVNFATTAYDLTMEYDKLFVVKENIMTNIIKGINLLDEKVVLIGPGLKFYSRYQEDIDPIMAACRPDYLLYPLRKENKMSQSDVVQFFYKGERMPQIQDYHNSYGKTKNTYVVDENFWEHSIEDLEWCYSFLRKDKKIIFKFPINFDAILEEKRKVEIFSSLKIEYDQNDIICDLNSKEKMSAFLECMRKLPETKRSRMQIKTKIFYEKDHFKHPSQPFKDLVRYFDFVNEIKKLKIHVVLQAPPRSFSPFWFHFEDIESWTQNNLHLSYVEFMSLPNRLMKDCLDLNFFFNDPLIWVEDGIDRMRRLWIHYPELMERIGYTKWGNEKLRNFDMRNIFTAAKFKEN